MENDRTRIAGTLKTLRPEFVKNFTRLIQIPQRITGTMTLWGSEVHLRINIILKRFFRLSQKGGSAFSLRWKLWDSQEEYRCFVRDGLCITSPALRAPAMMDHTLGKT